MRIATLLLAFAPLSVPAAAQRPHTPPAAAAPATPAKPAEPQRTTATFDDWTLRCVRPENGSPGCEVTQTLVDKDRPVAQTAIGRPAVGESLRLTILVPVNIQIGTAPRLAGPEGQTMVDLGWRRCVPGGCLADAALSEEQVQSLRKRTDPARILFKDAAGRDAVIPFTPRGLPQALDALVKESGS